MSSQYRVVVANRIEDFIAKNSRFIKHCYQLSNSPFWGKTEVLYDSAITFTRRTLKSSIIERGKSPTSLRAFTFHSVSDKFIRSGVPFVKGDVSVSSSGNPFTSFTLEGCHYHTLVASDGFARKMLSDKEWKTYLEINKDERTVVVKNSHECKPIIGVIDHALNDLANGKLVETNASEINDIRQALLKKLVVMIKHAKLEKPRANASSRLLYKASEAIMNTRYKNITVEELADKTGTSRRNLELVFRSQIGLSPKQFILNVRLNRIRYELLTNSHANVNGVVKRHGIKHLGHFSKAYKNLFLELPSETRARASARQAELVN